MLIIVKAPDWCGFIYWLESEVTNKFCNFADDDVPMRMAADAKVLCRIRRHRLVFEKY